jgi:hypothetical protein
VEAAIFKHVYITFAKNVQLQLLILDSYIGFKFPSLTACLAFKYGWLLKLFLNMKTKTPPFLEAWLPATPVLTSHPCIPDRTLACCVHCTRMMLQGTLSPPHRKCRTSKTSSLVGPPILQGLAGHWLPILWEGCPRPNLGCRTRIWKKKF